ncbi:MAG: GatB/YqeY domain-containing protein, partial [Candidatus Wildermuthbacteria bacterium]|nr:GatB/YqeY domain-containing protein [Candidatus Wildermuthbacteria bacterium]
ELEELAKEAVQATGASSIKDMGKVMARLSPKIKGRADGATVSKVVKKLLGND